MSDIAILGTGRIGGALARKWSGKHRLWLGARDPGKQEVSQLASEVGATAATLADAVDAAQVVVFAMPGDAVGPAIEALGERLDGKVVVDAANDVRAAEANCLAALRQAAPRAAYARAFNSIGWEMLANPVVAGQAASLFYCSSAGVQEDVEALIRDVGLEPVRVGDEDAVEVVDGVLRLWFALVMGQGHSRRLAFKLLEE